MRVVGEDRFAYAVEPTRFACNTHSHLYAHIHRRPEM